MIFAAFLAALSQILLKLSAGKKYKHIVFEYLNPSVVIGYGILILTMAMNVVAYRWVEYKYGPVLNATSYVFILLLGKIILKEELTKKKIIGNVFIILGILIYSLR